MIEALYRKWRPARFDDVIGQEHVTRTLRNSVAAGRVGHAYLFCGPRGTGKTTCARLLAKAVNCLHDDPTERPCDGCHPCQAINAGRFLDLIEIDAASNTGVDDIRDLRDKINFAPAEGRFKVYIIDEVHMLSTAAFNALLKTLEEPPPHAKFVLATTEEHKVPLTIKSRCQQFNFRLLTMSEITGRLSWLAEQEDLTIDPAALRLIARHGAGSLRDAESLLDQLVTIPGDEITLERAQMILGTASEAMVHDLTDAWLTGDGPAGLALIQEALATGVDARQFCRQMVDYLRAVLLLHAAGSALTLDVTTEQQAMMLAQAERADRQKLIDAIKAFNEAALTPATSWQPQLPLELAFMGLLPEYRPVTVAREPAPAPTAPEPAASPETDAPAAAPAPAITSPPATPSPETATTSPPPPPPSTARPEAPYAVDDFRARWAQMVERVAEKDRNLPPLLAMCKPIAVEGQTLILGFDFDVLRTKFEERAGAKEIVAETFSQILDHPCRVRCVVSGQYRPPAGRPRPVLGETRPEPAENVRDQFYALAAELGGTVQET